MARNGHRGSFDDDTPTAAQQARRSAELFAGGDFEAYARQEAARAQQAIEDRNKLRRDFGLALDVIVAVGEEPSHTAPEAVGALLLEKEQEEVATLDSLRVAYEADTINDGDRIPPRPNFPTAVGGATLHPELADGSWRDDSWYLTFRDIEAL